MKVIAAYLLSNLTEEKVDEKKIKKILSSVGAQVDADRVKSLLSALEGKDLAEIIQEGNSKLASVPSGAGAVASTGGAGAAAAQDAPAAEEKEEAKEESDEDMGFGLFD